MQISLTKCHGSGNDFLLIDEISNNYFFTEEDRQNLSIALCDRQSKIGADGILFVLKSEKCDARMRVFNSDGSEASMCGNGLRCVGRFVCELFNKEEIVVETMKADLAVTKTNPIFAEIPTFNVEISPVLFSLEKLPMNIDKNILINEKVPEISDRLLFSAVAVPNPHLISVVGIEQIVSNEQKCISETVNGPNNLFPDGVNVSFVHPIDKGSIYVRTFERGVGFTNACGTAMSASSLITCLLELNEFENEIEVYNNGGKVHCLVHKEGETDFQIELIGNATYLYKSDLEIDVKKPEDFLIINKTEYQEELQYKELQQHAKEMVEGKILLSR
ncbi:diaminopimelate epimerase [Bacillus pakistanensis]|uniref:Diaminopimelate epimerase n=1 Tax=Rossellomorea pakistanensis TaxID=992288 RepID=A0ABS2N8M2_9BACI|nr:diaminopimelate epimerase [Bacillus pakistanensis]MBM7584183.1 diaminopimelate epimerase [Bacillus pakistanensis]